MVEIRFAKYAFGEIIWKELVLVTSTAGEVYFLWV
jgi:hypothetical protein